MRKKALVVGSIGFDIIFGIHGDIKDELPMKNGEIGNINLMFTAQNKEVYYGGTGGNISYGMGLLDKSPLLFSVAGEDFMDDYKKHLKKMGVNLRVYIPEMEDKTYTAAFYGISDEKYQQIGIWQPNTYGDFIDEIPLEKTLDSSEFDKLKVAIFSPGTGISTRNHMLETYKKTNGDCTIIFDPSQVLSIFYDDKLLQECLSLADIVISNETEISQFETLFDIKISDIFDIGVQYVIETKGENGAVIYSPSKKYQVEPQKPRKVVETTGAGDAFRAGLMSGLLENKPIAKAAQLGAKLGALSVEEYGGQGYRIK
jgi:adenosine kinase